MSGPFRFLTTGESHGGALVSIIDGVPAGLPLTESHIDEDPRAVEEIRRNDDTYLASLKTW